MSLSSSCRLMRHLSAIVEITALAVLDPRQDLAFGSGVALELVRDDHPRNIPQALQQIAEEPRGRGRVAPALDQNVEDISVLVDRAPKIVLLAADPDEHLVHVPLVAGLWPASLQRIGEDPAKAQTPLADALIADDDPTRRQDQLNISQTQAEAVIEPDRMLDDRGREAEAAIRVRRYRHAHSLSWPGRSCQPDNTFRNGAAGDL